ncbi:MAG: ornithine carbamoyltransferase [Oscillatoriales cyanobacterium]|nr:MAG: ornithine carbamoyltransferase [Oscillatoriales cyanobacterium]
MDSLKGRDLLSLADLSIDELNYLLDLATSLKSGMVKLKRNKVLGLLFSKASTRTRVSFTVAMYKLGGQVIDLNPNVTQVSRGEPLVDTARVLDRYLDILAIRTFEQKDLVTFANYAKIPVINALTDDEHPCQVLADLMTVKECFGKLEGLTLTYFGDGNNMANSLMLGCAMMGMNVRIACPKDFLPNPEIVAKAEAIANGKTEVTVTADAEAAAKNTQVIYTDVWASMGQEEEAKLRIPLFEPYQVNERLVGMADRNRDEEITDAVIEGSRSRVWDQAENRMHAQQALLASILESD